MQQFVDIVGGYVWSTPLIALALGAGLLFSILTRFVQVRMFREMIALLLSNKSSDKGISSFQALAVSLSGRVGTGNIAGVAAAIGFGGPGRCLLDVGGCVLRRRNGVYRIDVGTNLQRSR